MRSLLGVAALKRVSGRSYRYRCL